MAICYLINGLIMRQQLGLIELALDDVAVRADVAPALPVLGRRARGDQDRRDVAQRRVGADALDEGEAVHAGHLDVDEEQRVALVRATFSSASSAETATSTS